MIHDLDYARSKLTHVERIKAIAKYQRRLTIVILMLISGIGASVVLPLLVLPLIVLVVYLFVVLYKLMFAIEMKFEGQLHGCQ